MNTLLIIILIILGLIVGVIVGILLTAWIVCNVFGGFGDIWKSFVK